MTYINLVALPTDFMTKVHLACNLKFVSLTSSIYIYTTNICYDVKNSLPDKISEIMVQILTKKYLNN